MIGQAVEDDHAGMVLAIAVAERARHRAAPNPHVGCVLVRDGVVVAAAATAPPGGPHAEAGALAMAGDDARGTTAYVTLEPCSHEGRTPACAHALVEAGVARVVIGHDDPNPVASGGARVLADAGVDVTTAVEADVVARQLAGFLSVVRRGRPHVTLKLATTEDGSLVAAEGRWITGPRARRQVHRMRAHAGAVLVGIGTVLADDPRLDVRHVPAIRQPRPVVLDTHGRTPVDAAVVRTGAVVVTVTGDDTWAARLSQRGADVVRVDAGQAGTVDLGPALARLADLGITSILAEPGARLARALVDAGVVDRVVHHLAGVVGTDVTGLRARVAAVVDTDGWQLDGVARLGTDVQVVLEPSRLGT